MDLQTYIDKKKKIHQLLLNYIEQEENFEEKYQELINYINLNQLTEKRYELKEVLNLIAKIANNHHRDSNFFNKIEQILLYIQNKIQQFFSNSDIFNIFRTNKKLLLFLFKNKIITPTDYIAYSISQKKYEKYDYIQFFSPEFKGFENFNEVENFEKFDEKREIGENDQHICQLIRNDSIDEFISFINQNDYNLNKKISKSLFETNSFLNKREPLLIEYASFFGSVQIFRYLYLNNEYSDGEKNSIWIYAIHGNNPELINFLEEYKVYPNNNNYQSCLFESIKCHHFDMTNYIICNYFSENPNFIENIDSFVQILKYHNYEYFHLELFNLAVFAKICKYNYPCLLELILKLKRINLEKII